MTNLPVTHMTLYKHGVGFFERRARLSGEQVELSFRVEEMNDILKSLTAIDWGGGQVLGVEYPTPQSEEERLAGCSIRLDDGRSLRDLLANLRGRRVRLLLDQGERAIGIMLGLDEVPERQPMATCLVSVLLDNAEVRALSLGRVQGVEILDERGAGDLRFFLQAALAQEAHRQVTVRLSPGEHDLSVSYVAPAPTWRVSYRLVVDQEEGNVRRALLLGWGIFDNRLEEDLEGISLSLVAGMPISFVYDLYTPFTPERPVVEEEARVAAAPVEFEEALGFAAADRAPALLKDVRLEVRTAAVPAPAAPRRAISREALKQAPAPAVTGEAREELFQYVIGTPVTVGRGRSAMVPVVSSTLDCRKDLIYNASKFALHPVATLRLQNRSGLTLERGPVTVIDGGEYVGEAILPFTVAGGELVVPFAVELGVRVREESGSRREIRSLHFQGAYLNVEEWDVRWREVQLTNNSTAGMLSVLVEHARSAQYELFDTPPPKEQTDQQVRFEIQVQERSEARLRVQERLLVARREELRRQSYEGLKQYLQRGLIDRKTHAAVADLLKLWERIADNEKALEEVDKERQKVYKAQQQIQGNMGALAAAGKEGELRARYVQQLEASEDQLRTLDGRETALRVEAERLKQEVETRLKSLE